MKKLTLLIVCLIAGMATAAAQSQGDKALGLNLNYASETSFGLGGKFQYNLTNHVRIEPEFNYYFKHDHVSFWDLGVNFHYLFPVAADVAIYGCRIGICQCKGSFRRIFCFRRKVSGQVWSRS